jgi:hypothetical protein
VARRPKGSLLPYRTGAQAEAVAQTIDASVGATDVDDGDLLPRTVRLALQKVGVPVSAGCVSAAALAASLAKYHAVNPSVRSPVNSIRGDEQSLAHVRPLVAEVRSFILRDLV